MKRIVQSVNIFKGLVNGINPSSSAYPEGAAYVSDNSRIDKDGCWNKGPNEVAISSPPTLGRVPGKSGNKEAFLSIKGSSILAKELGNSDNIAEGPNGYAYFTKSADYPQYWDGSDDSGSGDAGLAVPTSPTTAAPDAAGTRMESGIYLYLFTAYNATRDVESLPAAVIEWWVGKRYVGDVRQNDVPKVSATSSGNTIRIYRSKVIKVKKGDTMQITKWTSKFYFVGEAASATAFYDYAHDSEIDKPENLFTGRGSKPPSTGIDALASFQNRMFYFVDDTAWYSSAGRPEEVPKYYTLTITATYSVGVWTTGTFKDQLAAGGPTSHTVTQRPLLDTGVYGDASIKIKELAGETVVLAKEINGKLWVFTARSSGYIVPTADYEGFRYVKVRDGIGLCSPWTLVKTPYGVFGADSKGIWVIEKDYPKRLSDGVVDIDDSGKSTYCNPSYHASSFGLWVEELNEYLWCLWDGSTTYLQIAYQADRGVFVGPYALSIVGGCTYTLGAKSQVYVDTAYTITLASRLGLQTLKFWLGQTTPVKDNYSIEVFYKSITATKTVTASTYHNKIASETDAQSSTGHSHTDDSLVGIISPHNSGRFCEVCLSIPADCTAPVIGIDYAADIIPESEKAHR